MKKTLQDQYLLIKEGKGHKGVFLSEAKRQFPNIVRNAATFNEAVASLKTKNIISENVIGIPVVAGYEPRKKETYETAFEAFLAEAKKTKENEDEKVKAEEKKPSKVIEKDLKKQYDKTDDKNPDNLIFDQIMMGYYAEMKDPKNADKTMQQLKDIVLKNLAKDPIHYTKEGQFGEKGLGYTTEHPGLGTPKEATGKYKSSGYGNLKESKEYYTDEEDEIDMDDKKDVRDYSWTKGFTKDEPIEETKLRRVIREIIDAELEEAYQIPSIGNIGGAGEGGKRFIPKQLPFPLNIRKRFGDHIVYNPSSNTLFISQILYNNLVKGYGNQPALKKLIMDIPPMVKQILNKPDNYGNLTKLPKEFQTYLPLNAEVEKAKSDKFNKAGTKQYWSEGDLLIPNLNVMEEGVLGVRDIDVEPASFSNLPISYSDDKNVAHYSDDYRYDNQDDLLDPEDYFEQIQGMSDGDAFDYLEKLGLERDEILTVLKSRKSSLRESVEKDLAAINKEAEHEILQSKLDKIQDLIDKKQSQLGKLDEDEDMKALTDAKKVKEIQKDIKTLEKAKSKVEKMMGKKGGKTQKSEVLGEIENEPSEEYLAAKEDAEKRYDEGEEIDSILSNYPNLPVEDKNMLRTDLEGKMNGMDY